MSAELVTHMLDRVQVRQQARPWKTSDILLIFLFLDDASTKLDYVYLGSFLCILGYFLKDKVQNGGYFLWLLKFQIFFGGA